MLVLKKKNKEICLTYKEGDVEVKFWVTPLQEGKIKRISQRCLEFKGGEDASMNIGEFNDLKLDALIKRWEGIQDEDGKTIPCTKQNKIALYEANPEIIDDFLLVELDKIIDKESKAKAKTEKN